MLSKPSKNPYIQVGRNIGETKNQQGQKVYIVGSGLYPFVLTKVEYLLWKQLSSYSSIEEWRIEMNELLKNHKTIKLEYVEKKLESLNLIKPWFFSNIEDEKLVLLNVSRNGFAHGYVNGKWIISSYSMDKTIELTKEQFFVWRAGTGSVMLIEVVEKIMNALKLDVQPALQLVSKHGYELIQLGLWNVEYMDLSEGVES